MDIAGALPAWDIFCFWDDVKAGELIWLRLIDGHECLFWFIQNFHDGYLLGLCCGRVDEGPRCRARVGCYSSAALSALVILLEAAFAAS